MSVERIGSAPGLARPVGPFSHCVTANGLVFTSGQLPQDEHGTTPAAFEDQVEQAISNLAAVLREAGSDLEHVVSVRGFLTDPSQLDTYNRVYARHFGQHLPARTTVGVSLWGVSMEIDCIAQLKAAA